MSKIYEALRRHDAAILGGQEVAIPERVLHRAPANVRFPARTAPQVSMAKALEPMYPIIERLAKESGRGVVVQFVAASPGEGVSSVSSEFARVAARVRDSRVLLVDADPSSYATARKFDCPTNFGLSDLIHADEREADREIDTADDENLHVCVLNGGRSAALSRKTMPQIFERCRERYDFTVIDSPSVFSDRYFELSPEAADGVILVVQAEHSRPEIIRRAQEQIQDAGGNLIGAILNRRHMYIPKFIYRLL